jgi:hypothetical protein
MQELSNAVGTIRIWRSKELHDLPNGGARILVISNFQDLKSQEHHARIQGDLSYSQPYATTQWRRQNFSYLQYPGFNADCDLPSGGARISVISRILDSTKPVWPTQGRCQNFGWVISRILDSTQPVWPTQGRCQNFGWVISRILDSTQPAWPTYPGAVLEFQRSPESWILPKGGDRISGGWSPESWILRSLHDLRTQGRC